MIDPKALSAEPMEFYTRSGFNIAYVRQISDMGNGLFQFYARPGSRPDLMGRRVKGRSGSTPIFADYHEAQEALAAYAKKRGWKKVAR